MGGGRGIGCVWRVGPGIVRVIEIWGLGLLTSLLPSSPYIVAARSEGGSRLEAILVPRLGLSQSDRRGDSWILFCMEVLRMEYYPT